MSRLPELWLVRHGETAWSRSGQHTSVTDLPLTAAGEASARSLADALGHVVFDHVVTSPRLRARTTATLAGFPDAEVDDDLAEWFYGDYEGLTSEEIHQSAPGWTIWTAPCPGGESAADVALRLDRVVARARSRGGRTLAFAHGHSLRVLAARWLQLPPADGRLFALDTATVSSLGTDRGVPVVTSWNARPGPADTASGGGDR